ncbi:hypothetical protein [Methanopyrus sp.]
MIMPVKRSSLRGSSWSRVCAGRPRSTPSRLCNWVSRQHLLFDAYTDARYMVEFPYDTEEDAKRFVEVADRVSALEEVLRGHGFEVRC